jgi:hypothetical protein
MFFFLIAFGKHSSEVLTFYFSHKFLEKSYDTLVLLFKGLS